MIPTPGLQALAPALSPFKLILLSETEHQAWHNSLAASVTSEDDTWYNNGCDHQRLHVSLTQLLELQAPYFVLPAGAPPRQPIFKPMPIWLIRLLQDCNNVEDRLNVRFGIHRIPEDSQWIRLTGSHYCLCNGSSYKLTVVVVARVKIIYVYPDRLQNHAVFQVEVLGYKAQDHAQRLRFLNGPDGYYTFCASSTVLPEDVMMFDVELHRTRGDGTNVGIQAARLMYRPQKLLL
ncbi:hypothetical protein CERSUDRAFT_78577 [Gelatoporia subvermispora B]|uniref:Uncharacterized protein n=1 Tax=Ceriporiopsis subvermispora (strain B) TaxID=914234 RepID=M2QWF3_CERS8|nr:hypothetical protein CERSUDRAFT_78577 [Gelatoporia subvermispora B]